MTQKNPAQPPPRPPEDAQPPSLHRTGAVARMLRMPVATLRVWERRYGLSHAARSPNGQRLYSALDVRRLTLLKQLTDLGHAIGSLATLDMAQLQQVASTHAQALVATRIGGAAQIAPRPPARAWRVAVVGIALAARLRRPEMLRRLGMTGRQLLLLGPFDSAEHAAAALKPSDIDVLLLHAPTLQADWADELDAATPQLAGVSRAVLFGYATEPVCAALAASGAALLREPQPDTVLVQWLLAMALASGQGATASPAADDSARSSMSIPPRRWQDAALVDFAGLSSTIACECPRHVAELLMQLSHFEDYSAQCESRSPADARLHHFLRLVAAESRARFEAALEHVALHEGLMLPQG